MMGSYSLKTFYEKEYEPQLHKTFKSAVIAFLEREFPYLTGPLTRQTFVEALQEIVEQFYPSVSNLKMGQMLWVAVAKDEKANYGKKMSSTRLVPVVLTVIDQSDIERRMKGEKPSAFKSAVLARVLEEAETQGGVLSETDLAFILHLQRGRISQLILQYEQEYDTILPRRGNVHDLGPTVSHKKAIVKKVKMDGKSSSVVARETNHSLSSVDRYALDFERINFCLKKGLTVDGTSFVTSLNKKLVLEYVGLLQDLHKIKKEEQEREYNETLNDPPF
jgi:hypothetical protein